MECPICSGALKRGKYPYSPHHAKLGEFEGDKCAKCGEIFFTEKASDEIDQMVPGMSALIHPEGKNKLAVETD